MPNEQLNARAGDIKTVQDKETRYIERSEQRAQREIQKKEINRMCTMFIY